MMLCCVVCTWFPWLREKTPIFKYSNVCVYTSLDVWFIAFAMKTRRLFLLHVSFRTELIIESSESCSALVTNLTETNQKWTALILEFRLNEQQQQQQQQPHNWEHSTIIQWTFFAMRYVRLITPSFALHGVGDFYEFFSIDFKLGSSVFHS